MADPNPPPRVKQEAGSTTIGGVAKATFAPKIPVRRKAGEAGAAAGGAAGGGGGGIDLITVKEERKHVPRPRLANTHAPAAAVRVAFQPSQPGQGGGSSSQSGDQSDTRDVAVVVTNASTGRPPDVEAAAAAAAKERKPRVKGEGAAADGSASAVAASAGADSGVTVDDISAEDAAEEAELAGMLATESSYDSFLDNGDLVQYRPVLLPFPKVRMGLNAGRASTVPPAAHGMSASPALGLRPSSSLSNAVSMFDIDDEPHGAAAAATAATSSAARSASPMRPRSASPGSASYKMFPAHSPARLLAHIDHEEKTTLEQGAPSQNLLFFQFPSHLPFKQAATWAPPVNPLLALTGNRQTSLGANTSAISFGAKVEMGGGGASAQGGAAAGAAGAGGGPAAANALQALQTLQNLSSPMMPPVAMSGLGIPNLSLGAGAAGQQSSQQPQAHPGGVGASKSRAMAVVGPSGSHLGVPGGGSDPLGTSSALGGEEETDLGDLAKNDPNKLSESERLAREHKARQQRKLLLYSSNFEHAMRHLPAGQLGTLVIYKSGKIKMRVGDILLDVNEGVQCLFHQELMSVQAATGEAFRLGPVNHRLVCTNDVEDLVRKTRERDMPKPGR